MYYTKPNLYVSSSSQDLFNVVSNSCLHVPLTSHLSISLLIHMHPFTHWQPILIHLYPSTHSNTYTHSITHTHTLIHISNCQSQPSTHTHPHTPTNYYPLMHSHSCTTHPYTYLSTYIHLLTSNYIPISL